MLFHYDLLLYYDTKCLNLSNGRGQGVRIHIKYNFNNGSCGKGRVKVISLLHVLNCNLILRQYGRSSFGFFRRASCFKTSIYFTLCLNAQNLWIDSWPVSIDSQIYRMIMFLFYIQRWMTFHLMLVLFVYSVSEDHTMSLFFKFRTFCMMVKWKILSVEIKTKTCIV